MSAVKRTTARCCSHPNLGLANVRPGFTVWLEAGDYESCHPGELHGLFKPEVGCVVWEVPFPNRMDESTGS